MKKRFIAAMFVGTLCAAGAFVSCSDYDDDINELRDLITANGNAISQINAKIQDGTAITSVTPNGSGVDITLANGQKYTITNGVDGKDGKDGANGADGQNADVWTITEDGYWAKNGEKTEYKAVGQDGKDGVDGKDGKDGVDGKDGKDGVNGTNGKDGVNGTNGKNGIYYEPGTDGFWYTVDPNTDPATKTKTTEKWMPENSKAVYAIVDGDYVTLINASEEGIVKIPMFAHLKSLVFKPELYIGGIEAFEFAQYDYFAKSFTKLAINSNPNNWANSKDGKADKVQNATKKATVATGVLLSYNMNPANAKVNEDASKYSFDVLSATYRTRAYAMPEINVTDVDVKKGTLTVTANYVPNSKDMLASKDLADLEDNVVIAALRYDDGNDSIITSDYAAVDYNKYVNIVLNFTQNGQRNHNIGWNHLYTTAEDAVNNIYNNVIEIQWNNAEGIDLRDYVNAHATLTETDRYGNVSEVGCTAIDENALFRSQFEYKFELLGYVDQYDAVTSQSAHAAINPENGYQLRAQMPVEGKQAAWGGTQNQASIDKRPLVRVRLVRKDNGDIVAAGYMLLKIVAQQANVEPIEFKTVTDGYTISCTGKEVFKKEFSWSEIEETLYAGLGMSKADFENTYHAVYWDDYNMRQYNESLKELDPYGVPSRDGVKIGTFIRDSYVGDGASTNKLTWVLNPDEGYNVIKTYGSDKAEYVTYICFEKNSWSGNSNMPEKLYVKFTWKPAAKNLTPVVELAQEPLHWYAQNSNNYGTDEIHGHVPVIQQQGSPATISMADFTDIIPMTLKGTNPGGPYEIKVQGVGAYQNTGDYTAGVYFVDGSAVQITDYITLATKNIPLYTKGSDVHTLYAKVKVYGDTQEREYKIATLTAWTGIIKYEDNAATKELLNSASHKTLDKTITVNFGVTAWLCKDRLFDADGDPIQASLSKVVYAEKFLRPLEVTGYAFNNTALQDGVDKGSDVKIELDFTDWRDRKFTKVPLNAKTGAEEKVAGMLYTQDYVNYYGVTNLKVETEKAKYSIDGGATWLDKPAAMKIDFTPTTDQKELNQNRFGMIHYENNGHTVSKAELRIPATIEYPLGTIRFYITLNITNTLGNARVK